ncbi:hypothetical protein BN1723_003712 [Verticillium longisporum]|uniref:Major facilitator superfamily (MFS) profile domain-containing protein n=2 Tax=Verticillium longisporum TaxID=100787 RepID=A0A0G4M9I7_VERLO|nr:hypothetical protein BN1723_003712 [Verticillium longisporum]
MTPRTMSPSETTPLLPPGPGARVRAGAAISPAPEKFSGLGPRLCSPENRILFAGFLVALTLGLTQVSIIYVFRVMTCEAFYTHHPPSTARCARREIDAATATQVSILGMTTSLCGILNLFICGALIKRWGTRWALVSQTSLLAVRVSFQIAAVSVGGRKGIYLMQGTQFVGVFGGPRGYMLVLNTAVAEAIERRKHTGVFGKLQGALMIGNAGGYFFGGLLGDLFGISSPFTVAVGCFMVATIYGALFMPASPVNEDEVADKDGKSTSGMFAPLRILIPQRYRLPSGKVTRHYGLVFLAMGVFFGVFATGYAPILIQMYATSRFDFGTTENGTLMAGNSLIRGVFLMFMFPKIIDLGRCWFASMASRPHHESPVTDQLEDATIPTHAEDLDPLPGLMNAEEPTNAPPEEEDEDSTFDLSFLRWSLVVDGIVTSISAWATKGWHMYLAAFLLPFASGSAPAAKGVITEMSPANLRQDALSAITLVESAATLTTQGTFGFIYSSLSGVGKANLTFLCNGGLAVIAVAILLLAHYPPTDGLRVEDDEDERQSLASS